MKNRRVETPPRSRPLARRRVLAVLAAAAGFSLAGRADAHRAAARNQLFEWRGTALGASAKLLLAHPEPGRAQAAVGRSLDEVARLERIFSLHDADSELSRLNRAGRLANPSHDLRMVLSEARRFGALTRGAFDVTVQPLWRLHRDHFARPGADPAGPDPRLVDAARARVDFRAIDLEGARVRLARPGMSVTLNGIAQGYISDRVAGLLSDSGFEQALVQLGETVALGAPESAAGWTVGLPHPEVPERTLARLSLSRGAVATSSPLATRFDALGRHHHIFDPASGTSARGPIGISVTAQRAMVADALSTALAIVPEGRAAALLAAAGADGALLVRADGRTLRLGPEGPALPGRTKTTRGG
jgi:thiamine biosynthesis lipoprotein